MMVIFIGLFIFLFYMLFVVIYFIVCLFGYYGLNCKECCSGYCMNDKLCDFVSGYCFNGCYDGYFGIWCNICM